MDDMNEQWKSVVGFEDRYEVSNLGKVRRMAYEIITVDRGDGYRVVGLCNGGKRGKRRYAHRLVAEAFLEAPPNGYCQVNHKDNNPANNHLENLEWVTPHQNAIHAKHKGVLGPGRIGHWARGESHYAAKLTDERVREIRRLWFLNQKRGTKSRLARQFNVSEALIDHVVRNKTWKHVI